MPDDRLSDARTTSGPPGDWSAAFAALPLETPPSDGWRRIASRLPATRRTRWPAWLATAAVLALVAALPMKLPGPDDVVVPRPDAPPRAQRTPPASDTPAMRVTAVAPLRSATQPVRDARLDGDRVAATPASEARENHDARPHDDHSMRGTARAERTGKAKTIPAGATGRIARHAARPDASTHAAGASQVASMPDDMAPRTTDAAQPAMQSSELDQLYAESAQLEALLALARDDRVASGTAVALGDAFDARVAGIDAALTQPDIDAARRTALWRERVDAMRQLASFESTQRLLAARGERYDAMLVSVD